jgi:hypothetical protein
MGQDPARRAEVRGRGLGARQRPSAVPEGDRPQCKIAVNNDPALNLMQRIAPVA